MKTNRQTLIRELLVGTAVSNQDDLRRKLAGKGIHVTQATVSRDFSEVLPATSCLMPTPRTMTATSRTSTTPCLPSPSCSPASASKSVRPPINSCYSPPKAPLAP